MALVVGTNCGFVKTAPTGDPNAASHTAIIDGFTRITLFTSPATAIKITEIGWYCYNASEASDFRVGLYAADGAVVPGEAGTLLYSDTTHAKGTDAGWKVVSGLDWTITGSTNYWLAASLTNTATNTIIESEVLGLGNDSGATDFPNPFGGGTYFTSTLAMYAVYYAAPDRIQKKLHTMSQFWG